MPKQVKDKEGQPINIGDTVFPKFRGGKHEGEVEAIIMDADDLEKTKDLEVEVKNPPKVIFTDQHGHTVSHNPGTLVHTEKSG